MRRHLLLAITLMLLLTACTPATLSALFARCPEPTPEEWEEAQAEWPSYRGGRPNLSFARHFRPQQSWSPFPFVQPRSLLHNERNKP
jgi:hypothetical protein